MASYADRGPGITTNRGDLRRAMEGRRRLSVGKTVTDQHDSVLASAFANQTILITGSTGLIGSNIVLYLSGLNYRQNANIKIIALYRDTEKRDIAFSKLADNHIEYIKCDIQEPIPFSKHVDAIIHCACCSGGSKVHLNDPLRVFDIGISGSKNLLNFAVERRCGKFLYVSTYEVYGSVPQNEYITECQPYHLDPFSLRDCYAAVKLLCESLLCAYSAKYGFSVYSARLSSTFGRGVRFDDPRFFAEFARCILEGKDIVLKSEGKTVRSYLDVEDAATAFLYILARGKNCSAYNVTNMENEISIRDLAQKMIEVAKSPVTLTFESGCDTSSLGFRREGRTVIDASKLQSLGWRPVHTLDETILSLIHSMETMRPT